MLKLSKKTTKKDNVKRAIKYIEAKESGLTKGQALRSVGYSMSSQRVPNIIENTLAYKEALAIMNTKTMRAINSVSDSLGERLNNNEVGLLSLDSHTDILLKLVKINQMLNPTATVKQTQDEQGNVKTTKWVTASIHDNTTQTIDSQDLTNIELDDNV